MIYVANHVTETIFEMHTISHTIKKTTSNTGRIDFSVFFTFICRLTLGKNPINASNVTRRFTANSSFKAFENTYWGEAI